MSLLIGYDLNRPGQNYKSLHDAIKALGSAHWHILDSTWIVDTQKTCTQARDELKKHIDSNDKLLVVQLTGVGAWTGFTQTGTDWLKSRL
ncbi:CRISPR-associated protein Cas2 [Streptomyces antibioticus]|uniref:CRISPR-associated protein Cas2 n=1 Tax=Streptomyces antibioticus TaxID=1890 RepID=UPI0036D04469